MFILSLLGYYAIELEQYLNLSRGQIDKVLKLLSLESPSPVTKQKSKWYTTPVNYQPDTTKIERLTRIRRQEQAQMQAYMTSQQCLMAFLADALDDPNPTPCGKCAVCLGRPLLSETYSRDTVNQAIQFLKRSDQPIEPRKQWVKGALPHYNFSGKIPAELRAEIGRALCLWGDAGWGNLVRQGKYEQNRFDDALIEGMLQMIERWQPHHKPTWVTCVPSLQRPHLVPDFAQRLARRLDLPFIPVVQKIKQNRPQKSMSNSYQQCHNLDGVFIIEQGVKPEPVFLIDDFIDSRWTLTVITALLRQSGSGAVFPLALALNTY